MKNRTSYWAALVIIFALTFFTFGPSFAEDLSAWEGKWFKITEKVSLLETNESGSISSSNYSQTVYIHINEVDNNNGILRCNGYDYRDGGLRSTGPLAMQVRAGSSLGFIWYIQVGTEVQSVVTGGIAGRIQGKMTNGVLKSATIKTVGGAASVIIDSGPAVGGLGWSGSMVPESKVPPVIQ